MDKNVMIVAVIAIVVIGIVILTLGLQQPKIGPTPHDVGPNFCGDGLCRGSEDCLSCPEDCGQCPTPPTPEKSEIEITLTSPRESAPYKTMVIHGVTLPIDSEVEACNIWKQVIGDFTCEAREESDHWLMSGEPICKPPRHPDTPNLCGGNARGKIIKATGDFKEFVVVLIA